MRLVIQRVSEASVSVDGQIIGSIGAGLGILVGVGKDDILNNAVALADKVKNLRIFEDDQGKMNRSLVENGGAVLVISQFTLYADCRKGNRPSFTDAAPAALAEEVYLAFAKRLSDAGLTVATGQFQADSVVSRVSKPINGRHPCGSALRGG